MTKDKLYPALWLESERLNCAEADLRNPVFKQIVVTFSLISYCLVMQLIGALCEWFYCITWLIRYE